MPKLARAVACEGGRAEICCAAAESIQHDLNPRSFAKSKPIMTSSQLPRRSSKPRRTVSISGTGSYAPLRVLTNRELEKMIDTTDTWIRTRTGILERRIAAERENTSDMAVQARPTIYLHTRL